MSQCQLLKLCVTETKRSQPGAGRHRHLIYSLSLLSFSFAKFFAGSIKAFTRTVPCKSASTLMWPCCLASAGLVFICMNSGNTSEKTERLHVVDLR